MGRQLQILMNENDERDLISFMRGTADIALIESFAPTTDELWVEAFHQSFVGHHSYRIWNRAFTWKPEYGTVGPNAHNPSDIGWRYVSNSSAAPLLEISRSNPISGEPGRLYWARNFAAPNGLSYDGEAFSKWVDLVWRWVRKHGKKISEHPMQPYALPGALAQLPPNNSFKADA